MRSTKFGNDVAWAVCSRQHLTLPLSRPLPTTNITIDDLEPTDLVKLCGTSMVKSRQLMIPQRVMRKANQIPIMKVDRD